MSKTILRLGTLVGLLGIWCGGFPLTAQPLRAQETKKIRLEQVQLFRSGAVLRYAVSGKLVNGSQRWVLGGWAKAFDASTLRIKSSSGLRMTDYRWEKLPAPDAWSDSLTNAQNAWAEFKRALEEKQVDMVALQAEEQYMMVLLGRTSVQGKGPAGLSPSGSSENSSALDWLKGSDQFRQRMAQVGRAKLHCQRVLDSLTRRSGELESRVAYWRNQIQASEQGLVLQLEAIPSLEGKTGQVALEVFCPQAGWNPSYEMDVDVNQSKVALRLGAQSFQQSGQDWEGVPVEFLTHTPSMGLELPVLNPWYLDYYRPIMGAMDRVETISAQSKGRSQPSRAASEASEPASSLTWNELEASGLPIVERQIQGSAFVYKPNSSFRLVSGGKSWQPLDARTVEVELWRYAAPRQQPRVYLMGILRDSSLMDWVDGPCMISVDGNRVGEQQIRWAHAADSVALSLGTDDLIQVQYRPAAIFKNQRFRLDQWVVRHYGYRVDLRNSRPQSVRIRVEDQYPVSLQKDLEVLDLTAEGARFPSAPETAVPGLVRWELNLEPQAQRSLEWGFRVKHLRNRPVIGL
ncbi:MAG: DUF4139 domain-containing protein [Bacteroidia bacterium]